MIQYRMLLMRQVNIYSLVFTEYGWIPEWPKGTDCKSAAFCFGGSNPPPSIYFIDAGWSSLEARRAHNPEVTGSNPVPATTWRNPRYAQIAQLVEQRTENPRVTGSIPVLGTISLTKKNPQGSFFTSKKNLS